MTPKEQRELIAEIDAKYPIPDATMAHDYRAPVEPEPEIIKTQRPARKAPPPRGISREDVAAMISDAILAERKYVLDAIVRTVSDPIDKVESKLAGLDRMLERLQATLSAAPASRSLSGDLINVN